MTEKREQNCPAPVTREELARDLRALGLQRGDLVYIHSSLRRVGWMPQGPWTLGEALRDVLGAEGTLAVPTHTLSFPGRGVPPYDPGQTPTILGLFPETVRQRPEALRSGHGSHSSAAIGPLAAYLTAGHDPCHALGYDSPLYRLYRAGGKVLLLGVTQTANTSLHLAESISGVLYTRLPYDASWGPEVACLEDGRVRRYRQVEFPGCSGGFDRIEPELRRRGWMREGTVGHAPARLIEDRGLIDTAAECLRQDPGYFLCHREDCPCCPARWKALREAGYPAL